MNKYDISRYWTWNGCACLPALFLVAGLAACKSTSVVTTYPAKPLPESEPVEVVVDEAELRRARILADMLYDAKGAYDDNRLMLPAGNNAYEKYQEVLQVDPGNTIALEGIQEIALRYIALADSAINQGEYANADALLGRAARLGPDRPELLPMKERLAKARLNKVEVRELDAAAVSARSLEAMTELAEVAQQIKSAEATFLIRARSDEEGRWIYQTMRDAVGGYRLRGNIDISGTPGIVITVPANAPATTRPVE